MARCNILKYCTREMRIKLMTPFTVHSFIVSILKYYTVPPRYSVDCYCGNLKVDNFDFLISYYMLKNSEIFNNTHWAFVEPIRIPYQSYSIISCSTSALSDDDAIFSVQNPDGGCT